MVFFYRGKSRASTVDTPTESLAGDGEPSGSSQGTQPPEQDKRQRREIANSNERRRMQCINNGFVSLQQILPKSYMKRGEKMSKVRFIGQGPSRPPDSSSSILVQIHHIFTSYHIFKELIFEYLAKIT